MKKKTTRTASYEKPIVQVLGKIENLTGTVTPKLSGGSDELADYHDG